MVEFKLKIKLILLPYILIVGCSVFSYLILCLLFLTPATYLTGSSDLFLKYIPMGISTLLTLTVVRHRIGFLGGGLKVHDYQSLFGLTHGVLMFLTLIWGSIYGSLYWGQLMLLNYLGIKQQTKRWFFVVK